MGARSKAKALDAIDQIRKDVPSADIEFLEMDLSDLDSVVKAARDLRTLVT